MTDNRTTELLDGLRNVGNLHEFAELFGFDWHDDSDWTWHDVAVKMADDFEQAIAATLGSDEPIYDELLRCLENDWNIKASWDGLRKFWHIELTEEGAKLRDATHGTLTVEQVREAIMLADRWEKPMGDTGLTNTHLIIRDDGWQAIADELNAKLGSGTCEACAFSKPTDLTDGCAALERIAELEEECDQLREAVAYWQRMYEEQIGVRR